MSLSISAHKIHFKNNAIVFNGERGTLCMIPTIHVTAFMIDADYHNGKQTLVFTLSSGQTIRAYIEHVQKSDKKSWDAYSTFLKEWTSRFGAVTVEDLI
jgi:hypothetical protein